MSRCNCSFVRRAWPAVMSSLRALLVIGNVLVSLLSASVGLTSFKLAYDGTLAHRPYAALYVQLLGASLTSFLIAMYGLRATHQEHKFGLRTFSAMTIANGLFVLACIMWAISRGSIGQANHRLLEDLDSARSFYNWSAVETYQFPRFRSDQFGYLPARSAGPLDLISPQVVGGGRHLSVGLDRLGPLMRHREWPGDAGYTMTRGSDGYLSTSNLDSQLRSRAAAAAAAAAIHSRGADLSEDSIRGRRRDLDLDLDLRDRQSRRITGYIDERDPSFDGSFGHHDRRPTTTTTTDEDYYSMRRAKVIGTAAGGAAGGGSRSQPLLQPDDHVTRDERVTLDGTQTGPGKFGSPAAGVMRRDERGTNVMIDRGDARDRSTDNNFVRRDEIVTASQDGVRPMVWRGGESIAVQGSGGGGGGNYDQRAITRDDTIIITNDDDVDGHNDGRAITRDEVVQVVGARESEKGEQWEREHSRDFAEATYGWDEVQSSLECCGLKEASDWDAYRPHGWPDESYPTSCCSWSAGDIKHQDELARSGGLGEHHVCHRTNDKFYRTGCGERLGQYETSLLRCASLFFALQLILGALATCVSPKYQTVDGSNSPHAYGIDNPAYDEPIKVGADKDAAHHQPPKYNSIE